MTSNRGVVSYEAALRLLEKLSSHNDMLDYFFLGLLCLVLPNHQSWFRRDML